MCEGSLAVTTPSPGSSLEWARRYFLRADDEPEPVEPEPVDDAG